MDKESLNVLLIEDNPGDTRLIQELLTEAHHPSFTVACTNRLSEGLSHLVEDEIDVVLLDLSLPDSQGFGTFSAVQDQRPQVPIIVLTALDDEKLAARAMRDGAQDYLVKGQVDANVLVRSIRYAIERKGSERAYRSLVEHSLQGLVILQGHTVVFANQAITGILGYTVDELMALPPEALEAVVHPDDRDLVWGRFRDRMAGNEVPPRYEFRTLKKDGRLCWVEMFSSRVEYEGQPAIQAAFIDITERKRADEALRESEGKYRNLIDNSQDAIYLLFDGKFEIINNRFEELFGYTQDETNGPDFNFMNLVAPHSRELIQVRVEKVRQGESVSPQYEFTALSREGREIEVETSVSYVPYKGAIATQGILRDISARKQAEEALRERAARLSVIASIGQKTTAIMELNELLHHSVDLISETFRYYNVIILLVDGDELVLRAATLSSLKPLEGEVRLRVGSNGITAWVAERGEPLCVSDTGKDPRYVATLKEMDTKSEMAVPIVLKGSVIGVLDAQSSEYDAFTNEDVFTLQTLADQLAVAIENAGLYEQASQEIAERKRVEESLRIERDKLQNILDNMNDQVVIEDEQFTIIYQNRKSIETVGNMVGSHCYEAFRNRKQPCDTHICAVEHILKQKGEEPFYYTTEARDGLSWEVVAVPISNEKDERLVLEIVRDLTERKQLQEQLMQSEKMSAIGQLISGVAHELNNPLTGVLGFSQLLLMSQDLPESTLHSLETIHREAERAQKIVQNLLTFARQRKATKRKVLINEIVGQTLDLRAYEMRVSNIDVIRQFDPNCPPIYADDHQLQQVCMNIIINAEQAMLEAHGKGRLEVATHWDEKKNIVQVRFKDDGPGIEEEYLSKLFDPFFTTKPVGKGTGLGLSISFGLIQEHGGQITAKSTKGQGATFMIDLPVMDATAIQSTSPQVRAGERKNVKAQRILVVDDEEAVVELVKKTLEDEGHDVEVAYDGDSALEKLEEDTFNAVISDVKMPGKSGLHIFQYCKEHKPELAGMFLFLTGDVGSTDLLCFIEEQKVPYLSKPFDIHDLVSRVNTMLT